MFDVNTCIEFSLMVNSFLLLQGPKLCLLEVRVSDGRSCNCSGCVHHWIWWSSRCQRIYCRHALWGFQIFHATSRVSCSLDCLGLALSHEIWTTLIFWVRFLHLRTGTRYMMIILLYFCRHVIALTKADIDCIDLLFNFISLNQIVGENCTLFCWTQIIDRQFIA